MQIAMIRPDDKVDKIEQAAILVPSGWLTVSQINDEANTAFPETLSGIIATDCMSSLERSLSKISHETALSEEALRFAPPIRRPGKIWGIGLNYRDHAADLNENPPDQPASFMKPATAVIGPGDAIRLPRLSKKVTAEAELGVIIGKRCRNIDLDDALSVIFGFTPVIDMTALDILQQNPRYLTRAKSFDTFFSFGPVVKTIDDIDKLGKTIVKTVVNKTTRAINTVSNMTFDPLKLVAYHSHVMTLEPGDIISTGTPGAWVIQPGDVVQSNITGFPLLENPVIADTD